MIRPSIFAACLLFAAMAIALLITAGGIFAQTQLAPPQPNVAQQAVTAAMLDACKGAAKMRFDQAMVNQPIDVKGFREICIDLRACRDKLFAAVADDRPAPKSK